MTRIRIFVSFDADHEADLRDELRDQSMRPGSTFELAAHSRDGEMTQAWVEGSRSRIVAADEVVVICGEHTRDSARVAAELRMAQEGEKPYLLLWGRRDLMCTKPASARPSDVMYSWTRDILENQLSAALRSSKTPVVPASCKRP